MNSKFNIAQFGLIAVAIIALFGLFFFGKITPKETAKNATAAMPNTSTQQEIAFNVDSLRVLAVNSLTQEESTRWNEISNSKQLGEKIDFWSSIDRNDIASTYQNVLAKQKNNFEIWNSTGDLSVRAFRESTDTTNMLYFVNQAVTSYNNALAKKENTETKIKLAKLHTDVTGQVMNGVMLLQAIVEKEPTNIQANYELGMLSIRSGQDEKAIARFETIIKNDPSFIEAYLLKSQLLLKQNKKEDALSVIDEAIKHARDIKEKDALKEIRNKIVNN